MASVTVRPELPAASVHRVRDGGRLVVQTWLITRLLLVGVALWVGVTTGRSATEMLANWDVQHYFAIAANGYTGGNDIAFFPGWPLALRAFAAVGVPMLWAGVALAAICSALAAAALHRLGGPIAAVLWLLAPTTVFTFVPYTEAPFCAAAFWAWERATRGRWGAAAGLAAVACTLRVSGLFLLGALVILALTQGRGNRSVGRGAAGSFGLAGAGVSPGSGAAGSGPAGTVRFSFGHPAPAVPARRRWQWRRRSPQPSTSGWPSHSGQRPTSGSASASVGWANVSRPLAEWSRTTITGFRPVPPPVTRRQRVRALVWLIIPALTLFAYAVYLHQLTGDWNAWYRAQSAGWPRGFTWPWVSLQHTIEAATSTAYPAFPEWSWVFRAEIISMAVGIVVTLACLARRRWAEASWVGVQVLAFSCSYWFLSVNRAVLLWFPLFILIGEALSGGWNVSPGRRRFRILLTVLGCAVAAVVLCFWAWLFYTGRWAS